MLYKGVQLCVVQELQQCLRKLVVHHPMALSGTYGFHPVFLSTFRQIERVSAHSQIRHQTSVVSTGASDMEHVA